MTSPMHFAAIDCGTNSTRLLVCAESGETLVREMRITRLGAGVDRRGELDPVAIDRTISVLASFREVLDAYEPLRLRVVATSAVRDASNGDLFLARARETTGVLAELLPGEEEGRLAYAGATAEVPPGGSDDVVVDIGGGSTELSVVKGGELGVISMALGCVRLFERHLHHDPPTLEERASMEADIKSELDRAEHEVPALRSLLPHSRAIGLAGTVATLAMLEQRLETYERDRVHGFVLSSDDVSRWFETLSAERAATRARRPGMTAGREDVIVGGVAVLDAVLNRFDLKGCIVSESDILDGVVASLRANH